MLTISVDTCLVHSDKLRSNTNAQHAYIAASMVLTGNSMGSSEIWDKYHSCCIGNGKFHSASPCEIYPHFQYNTRGIYPKFHCYPCYY